MKRLLISFFLLPIAGCSVFDGATSTALPLPTGYNPYKLYLRDGTPVQPRRDVLDRYACMNGQALMCSCVSRLSESCQCKCPAFSGDF